MEWARGRHVNCEKDRRHGPSSSATVPALDPTATHKALLGGIRRRKR
jgi:hypothetical protein